MEHKIQQSQDKLQNLLNPLGAGYFQKTTEGKSVTSPDVP